MWCWCATRGSRVQVVEVCREIMSGGAHSSSAAEYRRASQRDVKAVNGQSDLRGFWSHCIRLAPYWKPDGACAFRRKTRTVTSIAFDTSPNMTTHYIHGDARKAQEEFVEELVPSAKSFIVNDLKG
jgi:hypothetical protein